MSNSARRRQNRQSVRGIKPDGGLKIDSSADNVPEKSAVSNIDGGIAVPNKDSIRFVILPKVSYASTIIFYLLVTCVFFFVPAYMTYSVASTNISAVAVFCLVFLPLLIVSRYGAVASLPSIFFICGIILSPLSVPEPLLICMVVTFIGLHIRWSRNVSRMNDKGDLSDAGLLESNDRITTVMNTLKYRIRIISGVVVAGFIVIYLDAYQRNSYDIVMYYFPFVILMIPYAFNIWYDRVVIFEESGQRYAPWLTIKYMDRAVLNFLTVRMAGLLLFVFLYGVVIIGFSITYYYIDNCNRQQDIVCNRVNIEPFFNSTSIGLNFANIIAQHDCPAGKSCPPSVTRFLPYLYFSVVTSTTVGYGDISPKSVTAAWLVILHHLLAIGLLIGVAGQVAGFVAREQMR